MARISDLGGATRYLSSFNLDAIDSELDLSNIPIDDTLHNAIEVFLCNLSSELRLGDEHEKNNMEYIYELVRTDYCIVRKSESGNIQFRINIFSSLRPIILYADRVSRDELDKILTLFSSYIVSFVVSFVQPFLIKWSCAPMEPSRSLERLVLLLQTFLHASRLYVLESGYSNPDVLVERFVYDRDRDRRPRVLDSIITLDRRTLRKLHRNSANARLYDVLSAHSTNFSRYVGSKGSSKLISHVIEERAVFIFIVFDTYFLENRYIITRLAAPLEIFLENRYQQWSRELVYRSHIRHDLGNKVAILRNEVGKALKIVAGVKNVGQKYIDIRRAIQDIFRVSKRLSDSLELVMYSPFDDNGRFKASDPLSPDLIIEDPDNQREPRFDIIRTQSQFLLLDAVREIARGTERSERRQVRIEARDALLVSIDRAFFADLLLEVVRNATKHSIDGNITIRLSLDPSGRGIVEVENLAWELSKQDKLRIPGEGRRGAFAIAQKIPGSGRGLKEAQTRSRNVGIGFEFQPNLSVPNDWRISDSLRLNARTTYARFRVRITLPTELTEPVVHGQQSH